MTAKSPTLVDPVDPAVTAIIEATHEQLTQAIGRLTEEVRIAKAWRVRAADEHGGFSPEAYRRLITVTHLETKLAALTLYRDTQASVATLCTVGLLVVTPDRRKATSVDAG